MAKMRRSQAGRAAISKFLINWGATAGIVPANQQIVTEF